MTLHVVNSFTIPSAASQDGFYFGFMWNISHESKHKHESVAIEHTADVSVSHHSAGVMLVWFAGILFAVAATTN